MSRLEFYYCPSVAHIAKDAAKRKRGRPSTKYALSQSDIDKEQLAYGKCLLVTAERPTPRRRGRPSTRRILPPLPVQDQRSSMETFLMDFAHSLPKSNVMMGLDEDLKVDLFSHFETLANIQSTRNIGKTASSADSSYPVTAIKVATDYNPDLSTMINTCTRGHAKDDKGRLSPNETKGV
ncbi:MAG: hypothetical protein LQ346_003154 [Caloplaca aetnensis]|nr:MAG: hypothetical protein LQ346_003154 [Caloplaca aetnensis]